MSQGRHGIKVLGLSLLAALGLMAFTAAAAQAGEYTVESKTFTEHGLASESIKGELAEGELLVPSLNITFRCTGGEIKGTVLLGGIVHASILYSGCEVLKNTFCKTFETKANMETDTSPGFITTKPFLGLLELMGSEHFLLVESGEEPFAVIYLTKSTKGCALPLENSVTGSTVLALPNALTPVKAQQVNTIPQATLESLWSTDVLKYGTQTAWLDGGNATVELSGALKEKPWGAR